MSSPARPWIKAIWSRTFATEDEADEFYEEAERLYVAPLEVDRFDGHTVRVYLNVIALESHAQAVEARIEPLGYDTLCVCGAPLRDHEPGADYACPATGCEGFDRGRG